MNLKVSSGVKNNPASGDTLAQSQKLTGGNWHFSLFVIADTATQVGI